MKHIERHQLLHRCLDELMADWITLTGGLPSKHSIIELAAWANEQKYNPTEMQEHEEAICQDKSTGTKLVSE